VTLTREVFAIAAGSGDEVVAADAKGAPHFRQKLASAGFTVPQEEQRFSTLVPHFMQNIASAELS
jgi:phage terminase large subunit-like protein